MYSMVLIPGTGGLQFVPMLITTAAEGAALFSQLQGLGWEPYGNIAEIAQGEAVITVDGMEITANGALVHFDPNGLTSSFSEWWEAVREMSGRCVLVVVPSHSVQLGDADTDSQLAALIDSTATVCAMVPVRDRTR